MKVLIADDDPIPLRLLEVLLTKWHYQPVVTRHGSQAWQILQQEEGPKLAILDWLMPGMDGVEICRQVRRQIERSYIYIILLTAKDQKSDVIAGLDAGADDYLTKPFNPHELQVRLRVGQRVLELEETLLSLRAALRDRPAYDPLTGLWNRAAIQNMLRAELERGWQEGHATGVIVADLDAFRHVNEEYGYPVGDEVLREVARRLSSALRSYDLVGRFGEDEFVVILPGCDQKATRRIAERIHRAVASSAVQIDGEEISTFLSLGIAVRDMGEQPDAAALLNNAQEALQEARRQGGNRVTMVTPPDNQG